MALALPGCGFLLDFDSFSATGTDAGVDVDAGDRDAGPPPLTAGAYQRAVARILCRRSVQCEPKAGLVETFLQLVCSEAILETGIGLEEPFVRSLVYGTALFATDDAELVPEEAAACLEALDTNSCVILSKPLPEACFRAWRGTLAEGARCLATPDCRDGRCVPADDEGVCGGRCEPFVADGGPCAEDLECGPGRVCRSGRCAPPGRTGDPCDGNFDCGFELWCAPDTGECAPQPTQGDPCSRRFFGEDPCAALLVCTDDGDRSRCQLGLEEGAPCTFDTPCRPGLRCDDDTARCVPVSLPGEPCAGTSNCPLVLECVDREGFRCVARPSLGAECTPLLPCLAGACIDGACRLLSPGMRCNPSSEAIRECMGWCDGTAAPAPTCAPAIPDGERCNASEQCRRGSLCDRSDAVAVCRSCP